MKRMLQFTLAVCLSVSSLHPVMASMTREWTFKVYLDDSVIGQHSFQVTDRNAQRDITINATFDVDILFINAYHYQHHNQEVWQAGCLQSIQSKTDDNGKTEYVQGKRQDGVLHLATWQGKKSLRGCIKTFAYWDSSILQSHYLLNAQTGELMPVTIKNLGEETIKVKGTDMVSRHYQVITRKFSIDLWYSLQQEWLALQSTTSGGETLRYQLQ